MDILRKLKFGEIFIYKEVACKLGNSKKLRAVGGAIGKNPIVIIVSCHRVIGSNSKLTVFSNDSGLKLKKRLLHLEKEDRF